jgi:hypothetical protein
VFFEVFVAEEVDGSGDVVSGNHSDYAQTLLGGIFEHVSEICCFIDEAFFW